MSFFNRAFERVVQARELEARRQVARYLSEMDRDVLAARGFGAERVKAKRG